MDVKVIESLIEAFKNAELTKFSLKCKDFELKLCKDNQITQVQTMIPPMQALQVPVAADPIVGTPTMPPDGPGQDLNQDIAVKVIKAPMVGTFYASSSPTEEPFVKVGTHISKGDVVCIVEAMKLMNEVESDVEGEVVEILVRNEEMVEFDQPLFRLK